jgi:hypothetical protein
VGGGWNVNEYRLSFWGDESVPELKAMVIQYTKNY